MNYLHAFYCWGQVATVSVTTMFLQLAGRRLWFLMPMFWAAIPAVGIALFRGAPLVGTVPESERIPIRRLFKERAFVLLVAMILCAGAAEVVISQWASLFAEEGLGFPKVLGDLLGPCLFAALMGVSRLLQAFRKKPHRLGSTLLMFSVACLACYVAIAWAGQPMVALLACAACGFFVAIIWPGLLVLNGRVFPNGGAASFGVLAVSGSLGAAVGPWGAGIVADSFGLQPGMSVGLVFALVLAVMLAAARKWTDIPAGG